MWINKPIPISIIFKGKKWHLTWQLVFQFPTTVIWNSNNIKLWPFMMATLKNTTRVKIWPVNKFNLLAFTVCPWFVSHLPLGVLRIESYIAYPFFFPFLLIYFDVIFFFYISSHPITIWFKLMYCDTASCALHQHRCYTSPPIRIKLEKFGI